MEKAEDKERKANERKMKEEKLEVSDGGKCWRGKLLKVLRFTGEIHSIYNESLRKVVKNQNVFLRSGWP